jgi:hypothetical protein
VPNARAVRAVLKLLQTARRERAWPISPRVNSRYRPMNEPQPKGPTLEEIKARFAELQVNIYRLLSEFVYWNDLMRYPDLPRDSERPGRRAAADRNAINESQIRYFR